MLTAAVMVHRMRKEEGWDPVVYGCYSDGYQFTFYRIDHKSRVWQLCSRLISYLYANWIVVFTVIPSGQEQWFHWSETDLHSFASDYSKLGTRITETRSPRRKRFYVRHFRGQIPSRASHGSDCCGIKDTVVRDSPVVQSTGYGVHMV